MLDIEIIGIVLFGFYFGFFIAFWIDGESLSGPTPLFGNSLLARRTRIL